MHHISHKEIFGSYQLIDMYYRIIKTLGNPPNFIIILIRDFDIHISCCKLFDLFMEPFKRIKFFQNCQIEQYKQCDQKESNYRGNPKVVISRSCIFKHQIVAKTLHINIMLSLNLKDSHTTID